VHDFQSGNLPKNLSNYIWVFIRIKDDIELIFYSKFRIHFILIITGYTKQNGNDDDDAIYWLQRYEIEQNQVSAIEKRVGVHI